MRERTPRTRFGWLSVVERKEENDVISSRTSRVDGGGFSCGHYTFSHFKQPPARRSFNPRHQLVFYYFPVRPPASLLPRKLSHCLFGGGGICTVAVINQRPPGKSRFAHILLFRWKYPLAVHTVRLPVVFQFFPPSVTFWVQKALNMCVPVVRIHVMSILKNFRCDKNDERKII